MLRTYILVFAFLIALWAAAPAQAHLTPNSEVQIDFGNDHIVADIIIPQGEYAFATGNAVVNAPQSHAAALRFLQRHMALTAPNGAAWQLQFSKVEFVQIAGPPDLHAIVRATPPSGQSARRFRIQWTAITSQVPSHSVLFVARQDFGGGKNSHHREMIGALQGERRVLDIDRGQTRPLAGFFAAVMLGMEHIAKGHDHLLFLIALLLPAPLLALTRRWQADVRSAKDSIWLIVKIATAFTLGHSATLIGAAFLGWQLPAQPVEIMIAVSIFISAIHAIRPLFPDREPVVALGFGLVHGLAFATVIGNYGLDMQEKALTILGFNIGIELVQLCVIAAIMPALLIFARQGYYARLRNILASIIAVAALAWLTERVIETANPVTKLLETVLVFAPYFVVIITITAIAVHFKRRVTTQ